MKRNRLIRNHRIQKEYRRLYNVEGKRHSICCDVIGDHWCLTPDYVAEIVRMELPEIDLEYSLNNNKDNSN